MRDRTKGTRGDWCRDEVLDTIRGQILPEDLELFKSRAFHFHSFWRICLFGGWLVWVQAQNMCGCFSNRIDTSGCCFNRWEMVLQGHSLSKEVSVCLSKTAAQGALAPAPANRHQYTGHPCKMGNDPDGALPLSPAL